MAKQTTSVTTLKTNLKYVLEEFGCPEDFCGGYCNTDVLINILTGRTTVKDTIIDLLKHQCRTNEELINSTDPRAIAIKNEYK